MNRQTCGPANGRVRAVFSREKRLLGREERGVLDGLGLLPDGLLIVMDFDFEVAGWRRWTCFPGLGVALAVLGVALLALLGVMPDQIGDVQNRKGQSHCGAGRTVLR